MLLNDRHGGLGARLQRGLITIRRIALVQVERGLMRAPPAAETFETVYDRASRQVRGATSSKLAELKEAVGVLEVREPNGDVPNRRIIVFRYGPSWGNFRHGYKASQELLDRLTPERRQIVHPQKVIIRDPEKDVRLQRA